MERHLSVRILLKQGYQGFIFYSEEYLSISTRACTCTAMETKYIFVLFSDILVPNTVIFNTSD